MTPSLAPRKYPARKKVIVTSSKFGIAKNVNPSATANAENEEIKTSFLKFVCSLIKQSQYIFKVIKKQVEYRK